MKHKHTVKDKTVISGDDGNAALVGRIIDNKESIYPVYADNIGPFVVDLTDGGNAYLCYSGYFVLNGGDPSYIDMQWNWL